MSALFSLTFQSLAPLIVRASCPLVNGESLAASHCVLTTKYTPSHSADDSKCPVICCLRALTVLRLSSLKLYPLNTSPASASTLSEFARYSSAPASHLATLSDEVDPIRAFSK